MAEEFEVRGPHEEHLEASAEHDPKGMAGQLAVITAVLATVGAMFSYMAGSTQVDAALQKNDAAIKKTEAANRWNYYQAKGNKQTLNELGLELATDSRKPFFEGEIKRYKAEKADIKVEAEKLEKESEGFDHLSEASMHQHHRWAQATTALQIAIAMAAIALLTKKRWLEHAVIGVSVLGVAVGVLAYLHV